MRILLLTAHSIAEFDDLRMLHDLGHQVFSIGAYTNPAEPADDKRPALPQVAAIPELAALVSDQMAAKSALPAEVLEWTDVAVVHHFPDAAPANRPGWITGNWRQFKQHRVRVIWRTCGQSNHWIEAQMAPLRRDGLQIVRYSPKERNLPYYAGEDALIRFGKDPDEWCGWTGETLAVTNITQHLMQRGDATNYRFWQEATKGLPVMPVGPGSLEIGGAGELGYSYMQAWLREARCYLYTGTQPASYTLGLIEAMMTGIPVVSIGPAWFSGLPYGPALFEGHDLVCAINEPLTNEPARVRDALMTLLANEEQARILSLAQRSRAQTMFAINKIRAEWAAFLS